MIHNLFATDAGTVAVAALAVAVLALVGVIGILTRQQRLIGQYRLFMTGNTGGNLEGLLREQAVRLAAMDERVQALDRLARRLDTQALQHLGIVRYNPFRDTGGDQSFALVLASAAGKGAVLSSLHTRDMTRVYAKPLHNWQSSHALTDEEKQAIALARQP